jgi:hypothetical protein
MTTTESEYGQDSIDEDAEPTIPPKKKKKNLAPWDQDGTALTDIVDDNDECPI